MGRTEPIAITCDIIFTRVFNFGYENVINEVFDKLNNKADLEEFAGEPEGQAIQR